MTTETTPIPAAASKAVEIPEKKPGFRIDPRYIAPLFISTVVFVAHLNAKVLVSWQNTLLAIVTSLVVEAILGRMYFGKIPHLASAYVSGISVGILLRAETGWWPMVFCAAISIASKYVLRWKGRHLWNPSNFGIAATLVVAAGSVHTLSQEFGNSIWPMLVIWALGSVIIYRLKRFHICATYVISFITFAALRSAITGDPLWSEIAPITGPMYQLFTFFMITDPKTTVTTRTGQMLVAFLVAAVECVLRLMGNVHAPYYALFVVGPITNAIEIWMNDKKKTAAAV